jgi:Prokaryotic N-terminal methylation motif
MSSERGVTLVELVVTIAIGMVVFLAVLALTEVAMRSSARVEARVAADQRARPVMQRLIDELHSTCLGPDAGPILADSDDNQLIFLHGTGSGVGPVPDKRIITLTDSTLSESVYSATGGPAPDWEFSGLASSTRQLLTGVGRASVNGAAVPLFQYFHYTDGELSPTPLDTPLSPDDAKLTVQVTVSFSVSPTSTPVPDAQAAATLVDSALVRFSPASEDPTKVNGPCV